MRWLGGCLAATLAGFGLIAASASAQGVVNPYYATIAARVCDSYTDISANKARNNIQESLRDLGPNTNYTDPKELINPARELAGQPKCRPLTGFRFTFGTGFSGDKVVGAWGSLSVVSGPFSTDIVTEASVPDRDDKGKIKQDGSVVEGATTIRLSDEEEALLGHGELRIQGGTPTDPVLDKVFPHQFAFGALRCADDNQNGDNVEFVRFPSSLKRVYCFAYYVVPPPTSGTIIVTKHVSDPPKADQSFTFQGNISYTPNHDFKLTVANGADASMTFYRAATVAGNPATLWTVAEVVPAGWTLTDITCVAQKGSVSTRSPANPAQVEISLVAGDTVRCTFTDALHPAPGRLLISKVTTGGIDTFPFSVRDLSGKQLLATTATTTAPGIPAEAKANPITLDPGTYRVGESLPDASGGTWAATAAICNAERRRTQRGQPEPVEVKITSAQGQVCVFQNRFVPDGSITILKTTLGGTGATSFTITPLDDPTRRYEKSVETTATGQPTLARGDATDRLALGRYLIQEHGTVSDENGDWALVSVSCDGVLRAFEQGQVVVELTSDAPRRVCRFLNEFTRTPPNPPDPPTPPPTPVPTPTPTPAPLEPGFPTAARPDIVISKRALQSSVRVGSVATYEITVRNAGPVPANDVVVVDRPGRNGQLVSARTRQADCNQRTPMICRIGTLGAGEQVTIRVRVRATGTPTMSNLAVSGSGSFDARLRNNVARARVRVSDASGVRGVCARAGPVAHAAC